MAKRGKGPSRKKKAKRSPDRGGGHRGRRSSKGRSRIDFERRQAELTERRNRFVLAGLFIAIIIAAFIYGFYIQYGKQIHIPGITNDDDDDDDGNGNGGDGTPPLAKASLGPSDSATFEPVTFDGSGSQPIKDIVNYTWRINRIWLDGPYFDTVYGRKIEYKFNDSGTYYIYLIVRTSDNRTATTLDDDSRPGGINEYAGKILVIRNRDPAVHAEAMSAGDPGYAPTVIAEPGMNVSFHTEGSYDEDGTILEYDWDLGDGTIIKGKTPVHSYANEGTYTVTCTGTDDDGGKGTAEVTVYVRYP